MATKKPIITLTKITKEYRSIDTVTTVLRGITLTIYQGEFVAVTGPSGSGKSTLMNILGLLDTPTKGTYVLSEENTTGLTEDMLSRIRNKEIGFVFQSFNLLPRESAMENVMLPAIYAGVKRQERETRATKYLTDLGLAERMHNRPNQLSGGQQQRVAIARALMNNPNIILADEPTGNLDTKSGEDVMRILQQLHKEGKTIILITHEHDIAKQAERIIHVKDGLITK